MRWSRNESERGISVCKITFFISGACASDLQQHANCHRQTRWGPLDLPCDEIPDSRSQIPRSPSQCCLGLSDWVADHGADDRCICTDHRAHVAVAASNFLEAASGQGSASSTSTSFVTCPCPALL